MRERFNRHLSEGMSNLHSCASLSPRLQTGGMKRIHTHRGGGVGGGWCETI